MKKTLFTTALLITLSSVVAYAGFAAPKTDGETKKQLRKERRERRQELWLHSVSKFTEDQFYDDFPAAANVSWTEGAFAEATFYEGNTLKTAYYNKGDELVGTTTEVDYSVLPAKAKKFISQKYPGYSIRKVILFDDNESNDTDMFLFNHSFEDKDTYFPVLSKGSKEIILMVTTDGSVSFFKDYR